MTITLPPKRPVRFFNTTGPCFPWDHYMLPPADRLIGAQLDAYIRDRLYWVLHAPRQTGKTTFLQNRALELNSSGAAEGIGVNFLKKFAYAAGGIYIIMIDEIPEFISKPVSFRRCCTYSRTLQK